MRSTLPAGLYTGESSPGERSPPGEESSPGERSRRLGPSSRPGEASTRTSSMTPESEEVSESTPASEPKPASKNIVGHQKKEERKYRRCHMKKMHMTLETIQVCCYHVGVIKINLVV